MSLLSLMRRVFQLHPFSATDIARAELEDAIFEHGRAIETVAAVARESRASSARLLGSINRANVVTARANARTRLTKDDTLADLIREMKS